MTLRAIRVALDAAAAEEVTQRAATRRGRGTDVASCQSTA